MRVKIPLFAFLFISFFSCNKTEDPINPKPIDEDDKNPELTISGFTDIIETTIVVSIGIVDDSTVETKVVHNGEEIATSAEKQFNVSINPYTIPVGSTDFIVTAKDAMGNEISETHTVEIKHLLMTYEYDASEKFTGQTNWVFFNSHEKTELAALELEAGVHKIYTDEVILENSVYFSAVRNTFIEGDDSYKNLFVQTYEIPLGDTRSSKIYYESAPWENTVDVQLNGVPFVNGRSQYVATGPNYATRGFDGDNSSTILNISYETAEPIYIRTNSQGSTPFDGKKENYFYTKILPMEGNNTMVVESDAFVNAENNKKIDIPVHDAGTFRVIRYGSISEQDFMDSKLHTIYNVSEASDNPRDYVDLPIISDMDSYSSDISYSRNGVSFSIHAVEDLSLNTEMPDWTVGGKVNDTIFELTANNPEVDLYTIFYNNQDITPDYSRSHRLRWNYIVSVDSSGLKKIPRLPLPEALVIEMNAPIYESTNEMEWSSTLAVNYDKYKTHNEYLEYSVFNRNIAPNNKFTRTQMSFRNPDYSSKSAKEYSDEFSKMHW
ncbi:hypothetical protein GH721_03545 [Kriegella sp. EG-1]|nr:hypothetical protein [Flavobacteriaceae bacterium EG-1]